MARIDACLKQKTRMVDLTMYAPRVEQLVTFLNKAGQPSLWRASSMTVKPKTKRRGKSPLFSWIMVGSNKDCVAAQKRCSSGAMPKIMSACDYLFLAGCLRITKGPDILGIPQDP